MIANNKMIVLAFMAWLPAAWGQEADFAVDQVTINFPKCQAVPAQQLQFACHRFERGKGFAVAERRYWPPKRGDDDAFEKLTIYFASKPKQGYVGDLSSDNVSVFFSSGPSSFPGKHGCYGKAKAGRVEVVRISELQVAVEVNVSMDLKSPLGWQGECEEASIRKKIVAHMMGFERLNAWYGLVGATNDLWEESHPATPAGPRH